MGEINFFPNNLKVKGKKIILRLDFNVPLKDKKIEDDSCMTLNLK